MSKKFGLRRSRRSRPNTVAKIEDVSAPKDFVRVDLSTEDILQDLESEERPFDVSGYGKLLLREQFRHKGKKVTAYLFQQIVILTKFDKARDASYYLGSVRLDNLIVEPDAKPGRLILRDFHKSRLYGKATQYKLEAGDEETCKVWKDAICRCLWKELLQARDESAAPPSGR